MDKYGTLETGKKESLMERVFHICKLFNFCLLLNSENGKKMYEGQLEGGMPHGVGVSYL
jgi:hypothetical protein